MSGFAQRFTQSKEDLFQIRFQSGFGYNIVSMLKFGRVQKRRIM